MRLARLTKRDLKVMAAILLLCFLLAYRLLSNYCENDSPARDWCYLEVRKQKIRDTEGHEVWRYWVE